MISVSFQCAACSMTRPPCGYAAVWYIRIVQDDAMRMGGVGVFVVDAHEDIAYNALHHERDVRRSVKRTRELEAASLPCCVGPVLSVPETAMVGLPEHKAGGV